MNLKTQKVLKDIGIYLIMILVIYLFYRSIWAFVLMVPAVIIYRRYSKKAYEQKIKSEMETQFRDALNALAAALGAGFSIENAITEARNEIIQIYGEESRLSKELQIIINQTALNKPMEDSIDEMARRSGVEDIRAFASVFRIAKRSGGNMIEIIRKSAETISARVEVKNEIAVLVSSKRLEQTLMTFMPVAMILYIDLTSPELLAPLYGNALGILIMSICLGIYVASFFLSRRIMNIEV